MSHTIQCYMKVKGEIQGEINKDAASPGSLGLEHLIKQLDIIPIQNGSHLISSPQSHQGSMPSGNLIHSPLSVIVPLGRFIPLFYNALEKKEKLEITILFLRTNSSGKQEIYWEIKLENAYTLAIDFNYPTSLMEANVHLTFSYRTIKCNHKSGNTMSSISIETLDVSE